MFQRWCFSFYFFTYEGETIGKGTFGKVKLATHLPTREKVNLNIIFKW